MLLLFTQELLMFEKKEKEEEKVIEKFCSSCKNRPQIKCFLNNKVMKPNDTCSQHKEK